MIGRCLSPFIHKLRALMPMLVLALCLPLSAGCGLSEYEDRMEREQKRVNYIDEENKHLEGTPLKLPEKKSDDKKPDEKEAGPELFFRPPKGFATTAEPKPTGILIRFGAGSAKGFEYLLVAVERTDKTEDFKKRVQASLVQASLSTIPGNTKPKEVGQRSDRPLRYDCVEQSNHPELLVYFYREDPYSVAIVFRKDTAAQGGANLEESINYSLASLMVGSAAGNRLRSWTPRAPRGGGGKAKFRRS